MKHFLGCSIFAFALTGCISYNGFVTTGDDLIDEANRPFAAQAAQAFKARQQFRRPVMVVEDEMVNNFVGDNNLRRSVALRVREELCNIISELKDLQLVQDAAPTAGITVDADPTAPSTLYRILYAVSDLSITQAKLGNVQLPNVSTATVTVKMITPQDKLVFNFTATDSSNSGVTPEAILSSAAVNATRKAMKQYAHKFGPPIYVTDTCQNGEFVRLNVGSAYGIRPGMAIEFYRHRARQALDGTAENVEQRVGTGIAGAYGAPVEQNWAWVWVENYDPQVRNVFQWTSAKVLRQEDEASMTVILNSASDITSGVLNTITR